MQNLEVATPRLLQHGPAGSNAASRELLLQQYLTGRCSGRLKINALAPIEAGISGSRSAEKYEKHALSPRIEAPGRVPAKSSTPSTGSHHKKVGAIDALGIAPQHIYLGHHTYTAPKQYACSATERCRLSKHPTTMSGTWIEGERAQATRRAGNQVVPGTTIRVA